MLKFRHSILALAVANGVLYSCLLPLWEGFDEPFHYGYVETIALWHQLPTLNKTLISSEISKSLTLVPISRVLSSAVPGSTSFEDWFRVDQMERLRRERRLETLSPQLRYEPSDILNYEAQQAPLLYLILAPIDSLLSRCALKTRILVLRILGTVSASLLLWIAANQFIDIVGLTESFRVVVLACIFESQMLWATTAHVGNDVLAVPLTLSFLTCLALVVKDDSPKNRLILGTILAAGLLTKAYFLAFVPVFVAVAFYRAAAHSARWRTIALTLAIPLLIAGPWYSRSVLLYGSVTGTQENVSGVGFSQAVAALPHISWLTSIGDFLRWSLWTGNWSFLSFSKITLDCELVLLLLALALYVASRQHIKMPEVWALAGCFFFVLGLIYQTCITWVHTKGLSTYAEPWYWQGVIPCIWILCFRGLQLSGGLGRVCAILLCLVSAWIAAMTYVAKLFPFYGGALTRSNLRTVLDWWLNNRGWEIEGVALARPAILYCLLCVFLTLLGFVTFLGVRNIWLSATRDRKTALAQQHY